MSKLITKPKLPISRWVHHLRSTSTDEKSIICLNFKKNLFSLVVVEYYDDLAVVFHVDSKIKNMKKMSNKIVKISGEIDLSGSVYFALENKATSELTRVLHLNSGCIPGKIPGKIPGTTGDLLTYSEYTAKVHPSSEVIVCFNVRSIEMKDKGIELDWTFEEPEDITMNCLLYSLYGIKSESKYHNIRSFSESIKTNDEANELYNIIRNSLLHLPLNQIIRKIKKINGLQMSHIQNVQSGEETPNADFDQLNDLLQNFNINVSDLNVEERILSLISSPKISKLSLNDTPHHL